MQLKTLVSATAVRQIIGPLDRTVENIAYDSRRVQRNGMFVALRGEKSDGHEFIGQAIEKGASVIVAEREEQNPRATCLVVEDTRTALADFAATLYGHPKRKLKLAAVTGTNGKTTTTELLAQMLNASGQRTIACGNIGKPLSEVAREKQPLDVLTIEVSSFQLEEIRTFRPSISLWLNFAPDHLDRYRSVAEYRAAKLRIFENQTEQDVAVVNAAEALPKIRPHRITFSAYSNRADFRVSDGAIVYENQPVLRLADTKLRGLHNIENVMATLAVGVARGLSFTQMVPAISGYEPRPHRCEFVRELDGIEYVNDSKATNLDAVEKALVSQTKPVVLIAGGKDKGFTFDLLRSLVKDKVKSAVLIGEMAESISRSWDGAVKSEIAVSLPDAVERARSLASAGDVVLFSPGTSSFDMFKSYVDRGDQFRKLVQTLPQ